jgi:DNA-binding response OmpR family regulator
MTAQELAVYQALLDRRGRVVSRSELARAAEIADLCDRRCDSLIVGIRRVIGSERIVTVRRRGWMLTD